MALFGDKNIGQATPKSEAKGKAVAKKTVKKVVKDEAVSMQDLYATGSTATKKTKADTAVTSLKVLAAGQVLVSPLITEKATNLASENKYVFIVSRQANKIEVAKAVQALYQVKPVKVNLINVTGKRVSRGNIKGQRSDWRKAVVTLAKGETIKIYEGV
jgi:large subunit ribosomal protein L23